MILLLVVLVLTLTGCAFLGREYWVLKSIGEIKSEKYYTHGEFQDYTDFAIYTFENPKLESNEYFKKLSESEIEEFEGFQNNYEGWIETIRDNDPDSKLAKNYVFERSLVDTEDYCYIYEKTEDYPKYGCYDLWFFDMQSKTLYYFHNNI